MPDHSFNLFSPSANRDIGNEGESSETGSRPQLVALFHPKLRPTSLFLTPQTMQIHPDPTMLQAWQNLSFPSQFIRLIAPHRLSPPSFDSRYSTRTSPATKMFGICVAT
ncbi:hypothetical protein D9757_001155 [Collybiopsis confluens]|uniref:Uncharacterized protein n=1 Tax=Collybiopsis confluens TaxID=2823264 RepID=A0A8H5MGF1_9AGAR|nr:hypothetical protein D9757_001155 [Collybiopsis confluens]